MCVVSMVMDHYTDRWLPYTVPMVPVRPFRPVTIPNSATITIQPAISFEEVAEFRRLLERAREYDKRMNQPDCELAEKKETLKRIAGQLGVDISFIDEGDNDAVDPSVGIQES